MKIVMLTGSPHKNGTTAALAEQFQRGAAEAGHEVYRFDAAFHSVHPCVACDTCRRTGTCAFSGDDMTELEPHLFAADAVVFVSPVYYFTVTAQLKAVIDRFYANGAKLRDGKKTLLLTAMSNPDPDAAAGTNTTFRRIAKLLNWEVAGILNAVGCSTPADLSEDLLKQAHDLGSSLR